MWWGEAIILIKRQMTALKIELEHRGIKKAVDSMNYSSHGCLTGKGV